MTAKTNSKIVSDNLGGEANSVPPILMYHILDEYIDPKVAIPQELFEAQMEALAEAGYSTCNSSQLSNVLRNEGNKRPKWFMITFDDAYSDCLEIAAPILAKFGFSATIFVNTSYVGMSNNWNPKATYNRKHLSWAGIRDLAHDGFEIGSHGCSHRSLVKLPLKEICEELGGSNAILEDKLSSQIQAYAYPYGDMCAEAAGVVQRCYKLGFCVNPYGKPNVPIHLQLPRISMGRKQTPESILAAANITLWLLSMRYR